jgi:histone demethylase JARID1
VETGLGRLAGLRHTMEAWEVKAAACLQASPKHGLADVERLVREGDAVSAGGLPSLERLKEACRKAREWWARAEALQKPENYPYLDTLEALVAKGRPLPVRLDPLAQLETQVAAARAWRERTARVFLKKNSHCNLLEVLSPRYDIGNEKKRKKRGGSFGSGGGGGGTSGEEANFRHPIFQGLSASQLSDPQEIVNAFKQAEQAELAAMKELRERNGGLDKKVGDPVILPF